MVASSEVDRLIPWTWKITPFNAEEHSCPTTSAILLAFAAVNGITSLLSLLVGHRLIVKWLTCRLFGKDGSTSWKYLWPFSVLLHLGGNAFVGFLTVHALGYRQDVRPKVWDLMLLFVTRPRIGWIVIGFFGACGMGKRRKGSRNNPYMPLEQRTASNAYISQASTPFVSQTDFVPSAVSRTPTPYVSQSSFHSNTHYKGSFDSQRRVSSSSQDLLSLSGKQQRRIDGWRTSSAKQTIVTELILQLIGTYYMGRTAHFAASHGYYKPSRLDDFTAAHAYSARMMYAGALVYLIFVIGSVLGLIVALFALSVKLDGKPIIPCAGVFSLTLGSVAWIASWLFLAGYVRLAGEMFCPPKLMAQAVIWITFSCASIFIGTGI